MKPQIKNENRHPEKQNGMSHHRRGFCYHCWPGVTNRFGAHYHAPQLGCALPFALKQPDFTYFEDAKDFAERQNIALSRETYIGRENFTDSGQKASIAVGRRPALYGRERNLLGRRKPFIERQPEHGI